MKFRRSALWVLCLMLIASMTLAPLGALAENGRIFKSATNGVRIREKPVSGSTVIGKLKKGEKVIRLSVKNRWYRIKTSSGLIGYVFPSNLKYDRSYDVGKIYRASSSDGIKVYKKAASSSGVKGTLTRKYKVVLLAKSGNWGLIRVIANGKVGYVPLKNLISA